MADDEDPSVTAAIINVVCELGARRPHDFLPLAPRLFELLVNGGNNWMAIKLIKLFATLTPLEPRLVRKLLPPLTDLIRTTPAMSLLYECINGIIQGGILGTDEDISGREEIANLCVSKLRAMITVDGDANLKYVALLAFNKIVITHPFLVSQQEDVILDCIDSADFTIRAQALSLVQGMVSSENIVTIVSRLMRQLKESTAPEKSSKETSTVRSEESDADAEINIHAVIPQSTSRSSLPESYRIDVITRILEMCSQKNYSNITDFGWYIDVLSQLVRSAPVYTQRGDSSDDVMSYTSETVPEKIGNELRSIAVKVTAIRPAAVDAAASILQRCSTELWSATSGHLDVLKPVAWIIGEYAQHLTSASDTMHHLSQMTPRTRNPAVLPILIQAIMKIFSLLTDDDLGSWTSERKATTSLLLARTLSVLEPLVRHPSLEVQERATQGHELLKLTLEAVNGQAASTEETQQDAPLLLTQAIPSLFRGWELKSVATSAQHNVPLPEGLDLDEPIHPRLEELLAVANVPIVKGTGDDEFDAYYNQRPAPTKVAYNEPAISRLTDSSKDEPQASYQGGDDSYLDPDIVARRRAERDERNKDDPFYIGRETANREDTGTSTPLHQILQKENGPALDIDSIPIMQLDLGKLASAAQAAKTAPRPQPRQRQNIFIAADENLSGASTPKSLESDSNTDARKSKRPKAPQALLQVDSSHLHSLSLADDDEDNNNHAGPSNGSATRRANHHHISPYDLEAQKDDEADMAKAMKEVERLRLEMQRAKERIEVAQGVDAEGVMVVSKKKKKKKPKLVEGEAVGEDGVAVAKPKKKRKPVVQSAAPAVESSKEATEAEAGLSEAEGTRVKST